MPRWTTDLTRDGRRVSLVYGFDGIIGFFVSAVSKGRRLEYDALRYNYRGLPGLLDFLVAHEVFTRLQVEEALEVLPVVGDAEADLADPEVRSLAVLVERVKKAAAE